MEIHIKVFGQLVDLISSQTLTLPTLKDTDELVQQLHTQYPMLKNATYLIAVDKVLIRENTPINLSSEIALLPPFSGG